MRRLMSISAAFVVVLSFVFSSTAFAQQARVIEETLVLKDPTVAAAGKWIYGGALEYWYMKGPYNKTDFAGNLIASGDINFGQPGVSIFAGYDDFTVNATYRSGSGSTNFSYVNGANTVDSQTQKDYEIALRWRISDLSSKYFSPYLLAGYSDTKYQDSETIRNFPAFAWPPTPPGHQTRVTTTDYKAPLVGIGGIIPVNERFGFRVDGRLKFYNANRNRDGVPVSGSATGGELTGTMYVNIYEGWNLQLGGKFTRLDGGTNIGSNNRVGAFAMLGYTFK